MLDKITSHNQKGGITAKNVTVTSDRSVDPVAQPLSPESPRKKLLRILSFIVAAVGFFAGVAAILQYLGVHIW